MILAIAISGYLLGLMTFYTFALFDTLVWDISYFGWAKVFDAGLFMWAFVYHRGNKEIKRLVKWLYVFAYIRLAGDVQTFFTGIGVNNEPFVALLFLCLILVASTLLLRDNGTPSKWIREHSNI